MIRVAAHHPDTAFAEWRQDRDWRAEVAAKRARREARYRDPQHTDALRLPDDIRQLETGGELPAPRTHHRREGGQWDTPMKHTEQRLYADPEAPRARSQRRGRAGRPHLHRADQRAVHNRAGGQRARVRRRVEIRDRARLVGRLAKLQSERQALIELDKHMIRWVSPHAVGFMGWYAKQALQSEALLDRFKHYVVKASWEPDIEGEPQFARDGHLHDEQPQCHRDTPGRSFRPEQVADQARQARLSSLQDHAPPPVTGADPRHAGGAARPDRRRRP